MKRISIKRPGGFGRLLIEEAPDPEPKALELRVSTQAIGVNFADCVVRMGLYRSAREFVGWPVTPGFEFAGTVSAVGPGVDDLAIGDKVFGVSRFGAYATQVVVPRGYVHSLPPALTMAQAGTFPVAFLTAWYAVFEACRLRPGSKVLVHSAAGGVGSALCQLASSAGAEVLGVVGSPGKREAALANGAARVVDKSRETLWEAARAFAPKGFHAVFEANGPETLKESYRHLAPMGRLVIYGFHTMLNHAGIPNPLQLAAGYLRTPRFNPFEMVDKNVGVIAFNLSYLFDELSLFEAVMQDLLARVTAGTARPLPVTEFPFEGVADAHRALQSGKTVGKLVLIP